MVKKWTPGLLAESLSEYTSHLNLTLTLSRCVCVCVIHLQTRDFICVPHKHVVFFYKAHIMAGQVTPTQGIEDFAWLTKQEIKQQVDETYWENTKDMLSDF